MVNDMSIDAWIEHEYGPENLEPEIEMERARLGIDGNAGFAHLGANIQEGDCEFVTIESDAPKWTTDWEIAACMAVTKALRLLRERNPGISYYLDPSHPRYC
jgi:hypothetical protein